MKKYPYIPEGKSISFVSGNNKFILEAKKVAKMSSTDRLQPTGAVVVRKNTDGTEFEIIGRGANHSPLGKSKLYNKLHQKGLCVRKIFKIPSGHGYWMCPGCVTNKNHAEGTAVRDAIKKFGLKKVTGSDLYLWGHWYCCKVCWDTMIKAGISNVYVLENASVLFDKNSPNNILGKQFE